MQKGPILIKDNVEKKDWVRILKPFVLDRINLYAGNEIKFNLMCVVDDKIDKLEEVLKETNRNLNYLNHKLFSTMYDGIPIQEIDSLSKEQQEEEMKRLIEQKDNCEYQIADEEKRRVNCREENVRRQHNYMPLMFEMLKYLSEEGKLEELYKQAVKEEEEESKKKVKK